MNHIRFPPPIADDMVRAILADRKTVTRRVVKSQPPATSYVLQNGNRFWWNFWEDGPFDHVLQPPYRPGDILYVRETFFEHSGCYYFKADEKHKTLEKLGIRFMWHPSIHMPREAARIFLRVTNVRVERLQEITEKQARAEGVVPFEITVDVEQPESEREWFECASALTVFPILWDSTIKSADRAHYGWEANPWVWVIEFERISREEIINESKNIH